MLGKIYVGVATSIFVGGSALSMRELHDITVPVLVMVSVGWPVIVASNVVDKLLTCLKN